MKNIKNLKIIILQITIFSYTYLTFCSIWFVDRKYKLIINHIPFLMLLILDIFLIFKLRKEVLELFFHYWNSNKILLIAIIFYIVYDIVTLIWANNLQYSFMKYLYFIRTLFLIVSLFLCVYDKESNEMQKNTERIIKCISAVIVLATITAIIRWHLGFVPYYYRISLTDDYNTFAKYMLFCLVFAVYYFYQMYHSYSTRKKRVYAIIFMLACNLTYLSGSRRAVVLVPVMIFIFIIFLTFKYISFYLKNKAKLNNQYYKRSIFIHCFSVLVLILSLNICVPAFESYTYFYRTMPLKIQREYVKLKHILFPNGKLGEESYIDIDNETKLSLRYDSVNTTEGLASRKDIWAVAIDSIKKFDRKEILCGGGNGYAWEIYDNAQDQNVQKLLELYHLDKPQLHWMHPHNLFFTEFLEGGLIKIISLLFLALTMIVYLIKYIFKDKVYGTLFLSLYILFAGNFVLGSTYGLPGDDLFWLMLGMFIVLNSILISKNNYYDMLKIQTEGNINEQNKVENNL